METNFTKCLRCGINTKTVNGYTICLTCYSKSIHLDTAIAKISSGRQEYHFDTKRIRKLIKLL